MSSFEFDEVQTQMEVPNCTLAHPNQDNTAPNAKIEPTQPKVSETETEIGTSKKDNSAVWLGFDKLVNKKETKAKCKYCKKIYKAGSRNGTSTLWKHFHSCIKNPNREKIKNKNA